MTPAAGGQLFVHLQKTGGTALLRRLRHHFGPDHVYPLPEEQGTAEVVLDVDRMQQRVTELGGRIRVVTGHFPLAAAEVLPGPWEAFTVLRDPVERTLSFLRHQREVEPRFAGATLDAIYADPVSTTGLVTNHMVKMLSLTVEEMTSGALSPVVVDPERLDRAQRQLAERIAVMGLQRRFDTFCADLEARFGWDLGPPVFMNRTTPAPAHLALRERIAVDNAADVELYRFAEQLWEQRHPGERLA